MPNLANILHLPKWYTQDVCPFQHNNNFFKERNNKGYLYRASVISSFLSLEGIQNKVKNNSVLA